MGRAAALLVLVMGCTDGNAPPAFVEDLGVGSLDGSAPDLVGAGCRVQDRV